MSKVRNTRYKKKRSVEKWILQRIFGSLLTSDNLTIVLDNDSLQPDQNRDPIKLRLPSLYRTIQILLKPDVMVGQAYVDGHWAVHPRRLYDLLYFIRSQEASKLQKWFLISNRFHIFRDSLQQRLFPLRSTRAVVEHYNTNPTFMSLILGSSFSYTCAFFEQDEWSLDRAQERKLGVIAERTLLAEGQRVLDMGCGWGYPAIPLAETFWCRVTGLTISKTQLEFCNARRLASHASERLEFINADFTEYEPPLKFDRVISVGMLEHVGKYQYKSFFDRVAHFMNDDGIALIHSMVEEREVSPDAWIDKNIFPGGYIPTISEVVLGIEQSRCRLMTVFTHEKSHYFKTIESWMANLYANRIQCASALKEQGLEQEEIAKIIRIWEYFLSSSQIAFSEKYGRCRIAHFLVRRQN
jgi:cyclopropane-fatty-acyl-phospholipid synthase